MSAVVWFRRDLRLDDNPAWSEATQRHDEVRAVFVIDQPIWDAASKRRLAWLTAHLAALDESLRELGGRLHVVRGRAVSEISRLASGADELFYNADYTPYAVRRDAAVGVAVDRARVFDGTVIHPPDAVLTASGAAYAVFTPYFRRWLEHPWALAPRPRGVTVDADVGTGIPTFAGPSLGQAGEDAARRRLAAFARIVGRYADDRDRPDVAGTSMLSADLKYGSISPARVRSAIDESTPGGAAFVRQLAWRDFNIQLLASDPDMVRRPFRGSKPEPAWRDDEDDFEAWAKGTTGYPFVDAGMRQLSSEGFMHNRVRLVTASFLTKHLLIDWRRGERWFRDSLIDADVTQNVANWQWVAGVGADAAPYFRIFNPVTQGKRFDPNGAYIRRWVPELSDLAAPAIHEPWKVGAGNSLWSNANSPYPSRRVDLGEGRQRALDAYGAARDRAS